MDNQGRLANAQLLGKRLGTYPSWKIIVSALERIDDNSLLLLRQILKGRIERKDSVSKRDNLGVESYPMKGLEETPNAPVVP